MVRKFFSTLFVAVALVVIVAAPVFAQSYWKDTGVMSCKQNVAWKIADVRRADTVYKKNKAIHATGEFLLVYVETENVTDQVAYWATATVVGTKVVENASVYAAWMYTGGNNTLWHKIQPHEKLTVVGAFDVAPDTHTYQFSACGYTVDIGSWFELEKGARKANN